MSTVNLQAQGKHTFVKKYFSSPTDCAACGKFVWGITKSQQKGRECSECGCKIHAGCEDKANQLMPCSVVSVDITDPQPADREQPGDTLPQPLSDTAFDIGTFGLHENSPGARELRGELPLSKEGARAIRKELLQGKTRCSASSDKATIQVLEDRMFLDSACCEALRKVVDAAVAPGEFDTKLDLTLENLQTIIGAEAEARLLDAFRSRVDEVKLRRVEALPGREGQMINFHIDTSLKTMQVPLNSDSEFEGNRLTYATEFGFLQPRRPRAGMMALIHDNTVPHGVTPLTSGVRYGLFLLTRPRTVS